MNSSGRRCGFCSLFFPAALDRSLNTESRQISADLHTMLKPLASGFFSRALSGVCLALSDPLGCVDGRLNVRSHEKGQGCLTSYSHAASLINRGPVVLRQPWRWTVADNCFRTITVFCLFECVQSLWDEIIDECVCVSVGGRCRVVLCVPGFLRLCANMNEGAR